jgi:large subunit ribosomal protein L22
MAQITHGKVISPVRLEQRANPETSKRVYAAGRYGATLRNIHMAPNKMRLVVDQIRGQSVERARQILRFSRKRAAYFLDRVLLSALGNADVKSEGRLEAASLKVVASYCDEGPRLKRFKSGPMGRARPILRRMCHVTVVLGGAAPEGEAQAEPEAPPKAAEVKRPPPPAEEPKPETEAPARKPRKKSAPAAGKKAGAAKKKK